jgi:transcriptional regulator with XRE-family HTH domain
MKRTYQVIGVRNGKYQKSPVIRRHFQISKSKKFRVETAGRALAMRIYRLRMERALSQKELGDGIGLSAKTISTWENGWRSTTVHFCELVLLADFFGMTVPELLDFEIKEPPETFAKSLAIPLESKSPALLERQFGKNHAGCTPGNSAMCPECREIWSESRRQEAS